MAPAHVGRATWLVMYCSLTKICAPPFGRARPRGMHQADTKLYKDFETVLEVVKRFLFVEVVNMYCL